LDLSSGLRTELADVPRKRTARKIIRLFLVSLAFLAVLLFVVGSWIASDVVIAPAPGKVAWPSISDVTPEDVSFSATDGVELKGWFLSGTRSGGAVVLLHGISANRLQMLSRALWLRSLGYSVLLYDARGYGESQSVHPTFGFRETRDLLGALSWLKMRGYSRLGCIGFSQGAATVLLASAQLPPEVKAVVAEAPYVTLRQTVDDHFRQHTGLPGAYGGALIVPFAEWKLGFSQDDVSPLREIPHLKSSLYLVGGQVDVLAPPGGMRALYAAASCAKRLWLVPNAGHGDFLLYAEANYKQRIGDFLNQNL
jgi:fermentation-respiration switch protein FrsA (DUF1100 family)